jgi:hypothetical protein
MTSLGPFLRKGGRSGAITVAGTALCLFSLASDVRDAAACGGCFHPQNETSGSA